MTTTTTEEEEAVTDESAPITMTIETEVEAALLDLEMGTADGRIGTIEAATAEVIGPTLVEAVVIG